VLKHFILLFLSFSAGAQDLTLSRLQEAFDHRRSDSAVRRELMKEGFRRVKDTNWARVLYLYKGKDSVYSSSIYAYVYHSGDTVDAIEFIFPAEQTEYWEKQLLSAGAGYRMKAESGADVWVDDRFMYLLEAGKRHSIAILIRPRQ
jgi:hypothetical protein